MCLFFQGGHLLEFWYFKGPYPIGPLLATALRGSLEKTINKCSKKRTRTEQVDNQMFKYLETCGKARPFSNEKIVFKKTLINCPKSIENV